MGAEDYKAIRTWGVKVFPSLLLYPLAYFYTP